MKKSFDFKAGWIGKLVFGLVVVVGLTFAAVKGAQIVEKGECLPCNIK